MLASEHLVGEISGFFGNGTARHGLSHDAEYDTRVRKKSNCVVFDRFLSSECAQKPPSLHVSDGSPNLSSTVYEKSRSRQ